MNLQELRTRFYKIIDTKNSWGKTQLKREMDNLLFNMVDEKTISRLEEEAYARTALSEKDC